MSKKVILIFIGFLMFLHCSANDGTALYYGSKGTVFVNIQLRDSKAYVEYCYIDFMGTSNTKFDTLSYFKNNYVGEFSRIKLLGNNMLFSPGNIELKQGEPDNSFNRRRNLGYLQYIGRQYKKTLKWTGAKLDDFETKKWSQMNSIQLSPEDFRGMIGNTCDSLYKYYTSVYCQKYSHVLIKDSRIFPKRYLDSSDTSKVHKIWQLLSTGKPKQKNIIPYLAQFPVPITGLAIFDVNPVVLAAPIVYPITYLALIGSEKLVAGRFTARSTYKIVFTSNENKKYAIKVRNSKIIRNDFNYSLPFNFEKTILKDMND